MIEKFNGIIYLLIYIIHFGILAFYASMDTDGNLYYVCKTKWC